MRASSLWVEEVRRSAVGLRRSCDSTMDKMCVSRSLEESAEAGHGSEAGRGFSLCRARVACLGVVESWKRPRETKERVSREARRTARGGGFRLRRTLGPTRG